MLPWFTSIFSQHSCTALVAYIGLLLLEMTTGLCFNIASSTSYGKICYYIVSSYLSMTSPINLNTSWIRRCSLFSCCTVCFLFLSQPDLFECSLLGFERHSRRWLALPRLYREGWPWQKTCRRIFNSWETNCYTVDTSCQSTRIWIWRLCFLQVGSTL